MIKRLGAIFGLLVLCGNPLLAQADVSKEILSITERVFLNADAQSVAGVAEIYQPAFINEVYQQSNHQPLWSIEDAGALLSLLRSSEREGLNPSDYHYNELLALQAEVGEGWVDPDVLRAQFDVLMSDGLLLYARHLVEGKIDPRTLDETWNYDRREYVAEEVAGRLITSAAQDEMPELLDSLKPQSDFYRQMRLSLSYYRELADTEQFFLIPPDKVLKPDQSHANVALLRRRLKQLSYLPPDSPETEYFDGQLAGAVRLFQNDHGIDSDGIVGRQSYEVLNITFEQRVEQLRVNMDRLRWINQSVSEELIVVNIAGYELYYLKEGQLRWETPVMVGTINTRTPIFQAQLRYLEFNPTWNVPRSIIMRSLFAKFRANPQYVVDKGYRLLDSSGKAVDPLSINWSNFTASTFPYRVVQMPGPANAMGRVKFMFPNRHAVYLHDTPSRELFSRTQRAFSAGCIRVKDPLELARLLLDDPGNWSAENIDALIARGDPQTVARIQRKIDVMLMYWTVSPTVGSRIQFHPDVYNLDPQAVQALDTAPSVAQFASR
ncbi:MAG: L,D-transpeptidase family protein [Halieaceae bacterium]